MHAQQLRKPPGPLPMGLQGTASHLLAEVCDAPLPAGCRLRLPSLLGGSMLQLCRCALLHQCLHKGGGETVRVGSMQAGLGQRGRLGGGCQASTILHGVSWGTTPHSGPNQYGASKGQRPNTALHVGMAARNPPASGWWPLGVHHPALAALCAAPPAAERRADRRCGHDASASRTACCAQTSCQAASCTCH